jgi:regulatory protein
VEEEEKKMMKKRMGMGVDNNKHLEWAKSLCSRRECCILDLRTKLMARGATQEEANRVIVALTEQNFLNEERYVQAFVHDKSMLQRWGAAKIRYALRTKQLSEKLIDTALAEIEPHTQIETLRHLLTAKCKSTKAASKVELRAKLLRFGLSRGFSYNEVVAALQECLPF